MDRLLLSNIGKCLKENMLMIKLFLHNSETSKKQFLSCLSNNIYIIVNDNDYKNINNSKYYFDVNNGILNSNMVIIKLFIYYNKDTHIVHYNNIRDFTLTDNVELFESNDSKNNYFNIHYNSDKIRCIYEKVVN